MTEATKGSHWRRKISTGPHPAVASLRGTRLVPQSTTLSGVGGAPEPSALRRQTFRKARRQAAYWKHRANSKDERRVRSMVLDRRAESRRPFVMLKDTTIHQLFCKVSSSSTARAFLSRLRVRSLPPRPLGEELDPVPGSPFSADSLNASNAKERER